MARQKRAGLELWFNDTDNGWYHSWGSEGKRKRFGTGKSIGDKSSYKEALKEFHHWKTIKDTEDRYNKLVASLSASSKYGVEKKLKDNVKTNKAAEPTEPADLNELFIGKDKLADNEMPVVVLEDGDRSYEIDALGVLNINEDTTDRVKLNAADIPRLYAFISKYADAYTQRDLLDMLAAIFNLTVPKSAKDFPALWLKIFEAWPAMLKKAVESLGQIPLDATASQIQQTLDPETAKLINALLGKLQPGTQTAALPAATAPTKPIAEYIDDWLVAESDKVKTGLLEPSSLDDKRKKIKRFAEHVNGNALGSDLTALLMSYRAKLDSLLANKTISGWYHRDLTKFVGQFITWCHDYGHIEHKPNCMRRFLVKVPVEKSGDPFKMSDIKKLWSFANQRQRAFIALSLNAGGKIGDITSLTGKQLKGSRLIGVRPKTRKTANVPFNVKLWPITVKLIKECRDTKAADDYIFTNTKGDRVGTDSFGQVFKKLAIKAKVSQRKKKSKAGEPLPAIFSQLRDTSTDVIRKILIESGADSVGLLQVFLQHKDPSTAAYYRSDNPEDLQLDALDKATDAMQKVYGLKL